MFRYWSSEIYNTISWSLIQHIISYHWPNLPWSLTGSEKISLNLITNSSQWISIHKTKVGEEYTHEDRAPEELINSNLWEDGDCVSSRDFVIKPVVEVVTRWAVVDKSKEWKCSKTLVVNWSSGDEYLYMQLQLKDKQGVRESPIYVDVWQLLDIIYISYHPSHDRHYTHLSE